LASESAAEYLHTPDDWQKDWTHCFNSVTDSATLEENLAEFFKEAKTIHQGNETPRTQSTKATKTMRKPIRCSHRLTHSETVPPYTVMK
jgi:hypothetical protein